MYKGFIDFKVGYQPGTNIAKDEKNDDFLTDSCSVCMGLVILGRQMYTVEPLVPEQSAFEVEMAIDKLKSHKSPGIDQIPAELIKARGRTIRPEIRKLFNSI